jgi:hypothetical protein
VIVESREHWRNLKMRICKRCDGNGLLDYAGCPPIMCLRCRGNGELNEVLGVRLAWNLFGWIFKVMGVG